jgi:uncharacterized alpha/beta hydrolase family protein
MKNNHKIFWGVLILFLTAALLFTAATPRQADDPNPPDHVVKLIFIHHSTGENRSARRLRRSGPGAG